MIYFSLFETLNSLFVNAVFGILFGFLFSLSVPLCMFLKRSALVFLEVKYFYKKIDRKIIKSRCNFSAERENGVIIKNVCDFLFFFLFGVFFIIITYVFLDGVFRVYCLFISVYFGYFSKKISDRHLLFIFTAFLSKAYEIFLTVFAYVLFPFSVACIFICNKAKPIIVKAVKKLKTAKIKPKKLSFFKKIPKKHIQSKNNT